MGTPPRRISQVLASHVLLVFVGETGMAKISTTEGLVNPVAQWCPFFFFGGRVPQQKKCLFSHGHWASKLKCLPAKWLLIAKLGKRNVGFSDAHFLSRPALFLGEVTRPNS